MSAAPVVGRLSTEESRELSNQWRALRRAATAVALLSSPALFIWLYKMQEVTLAWAIVATILCVAAFRGVLDLIFHRFIEWPSLFGIDFHRHPTLPDRLGQDVRPKSTARESCHRRISCARNVP
jgi:hypothetical protein